MSDHNTLDDLVRVARMRLGRCAECDAPATGSHRIRVWCDEHMAPDGRYFSDAPAIRRLVAAGVLR